MVKHQVATTQAVYPARLVTPGHTRSSRCRSIAPVFIPYRDMLIRIHPEHDGSLDHEAVLIAMRRIDKEGSLAHV